MVFLNKLLTQKFLQDDGAAMRGTMDGDVAAERQLNAIERLLALMPRSRGFRVSTDGNVSVYPASPRARRPR